MEQSKALNKLSESADLVGMVEELMSPAVLQQLSPSAISGLRVTLRTVREQILTSHDALAHAHVERSREGELASRNAGHTQILTADPLPRSNGSGTSSPMVTRTSVLGSSPLGDGTEFKRRDLRAALEKATS